MMEKYLINFSSNKKSPLVVGKGELTPPSRAITLLSKNASATNKLVSGIDLVKSYSTIINENFLRLMDTSAGPGLSLPVIVEDENLYINEQENVTSKTVTPVIGQLWFNKASSSGTLLLCIDASGPVWNVVGDRSRIIAVESSTGAITPTSNAISQSTLVPGQLFHVLSSDLPKLAMFISQTRDTALPYGVIRTVFFENHDGNHNMENTYRVVNHPDPTNDGDAVNKNTLVSQFDQLYNQIETDSTSTLVDNINAVINTLPIYDVKKAKIVKPVVTILHPSRATSSSSLVTLEGTTSCKNGISKITYKLGNPETLNEEFIISIPNITDSGEIVFEKTIQIPKSCPITVFAYDNSLFQLQTYAITYAKIDREGPKVILTYPKPNQIISTTELRIAGSAHDIHGISKICYIIGSSQDNKEVLLEKFDTGTATVVQFDTIVKNFDQSNVVTVIAYDNSTTQNKTSVTTFVKWHQTPPIMTLDSVVCQSMIQQNKVVISNFESVPIRGVARSDIGIHQVEYSVGEYPVEKLNSGTKLNIISQLSNRAEFDGFIPVHTTSKVHITAFDNAIPPNMTQLDPFDVVVDRTPPVMTVISPTNKEIYTATSEVGDSITIPIRVRSVDLESGVESRVTVTRSSSKAGTVKVRWVLSDVKVSLPSSNGSTVITQDPESGQLELDESNAVSQSFQFYLTETSSGTFEYPEIPSADGFATYNSEMIKFGNGRHSLLFECVDKVGNKTEELVEFEVHIVAAEPTKIQLKGITDGQYYNRSELVARELGIRGSIMDEIGGVVSIIPLIASHTIVPKGNSTNSTRMNWYTGDVFSSVYSGANLSDTTKQTVMSANEEYAVCEFIIPISPYNLIDPTLDNFQPGSTVELLIIAPKNTSGKSGRLQTTFHIKDNFGLVPTFGSSVTGSTKTKPMLTFLFTSDIKDDTPSNMSGWLEQGTLSARNILGSSITSNVEISEYFSWTVTGSSPVLGEGMWAGTFQVTGSKSKRIARCSFVVTVPPDVPMKTYEMRIVP